MIDKSALLPALRARLGRLAPGEALELRTYKRDRSVVIVREGAAQFRLIEDGFARQEFRVDGDGLVKLVKTLLKREFPRSNKIRLQQLGEYPADPEG